MTLLQMLSCLFQKPPKVFSVSLSRLFHKLNFSISSNVVTMRVGCTLHLIFDSLTKAVKITFPDYFELPSVGIALHGLKITRCLVNCFALSLQMEHTI